MASDGELFLHLPEGYELKNGATAYTILSVLGDGGFGVTYLARDEKLQRRVAIKEYYPRDFAGRSSSNAVVPASRTQVDLFNWGKTRFLDEARTLARFDHPGIVGVIDFFEANNTAYLVMQYVDGLPMSTLLKTQSLDEAGARTLLSQLISALRVVHAAGYLHRDVKPANIMIHRETQLPVLIDFGAARQSLGSQTYSVTAMASASFSPKEQYLENAPQTAASEVYSICATVYRAMFQAGPPVSISRDEDDSLVELDQAEAEGKVSSGFANLLRKGLAYHQRNRFQSLDEMSAALTDAPADVAADQAKPVKGKKKAVERGATKATMPATEATPSRRVSQNTSRPKVEKQSTKPPRASWKLGRLQFEALALGAAVLVGVFVILFVRWEGWQTSPDLAEQTAQTPVTESVPEALTLPDSCTNKQAQACYTALGSKDYADLPKDLQLTGYELVCSAGGANGCIMAARWHKQGIGGTANLSTAEDFFAEACNLNDPTGCIEQALILIDPPAGKGVEQDREKAISLAQKACADLKSTRACGLVKSDRFGGDAATLADETPAPTKAAQEVRLIREAMEAAGLTQSTAYNNVLRCEQNSGVGCNSATIWTGILAGLKINGVENPVLSLATRACERSLTEGCQRAEELKNAPKTEAASKSEPPPATTQAAKEVRMIRVAVESLGDWTHFGSYVSQCDDGIAFSCLVASKSEYVSEIRIDGLANPARSLATRACELGIDEGCSSANIELTGTDVEAVSRGQSPRADSQAALEVRLIKAAMEATGLKQSAAYLNVSDCVRHSGADCKTATMWTTILANLKINGVANPAFSLTTRACELGIGDGCQAATRKTDDPDKSMSLELWMLLKQTDYVNALLEALAGTGQERLRDLVARCADGNSGACLDASLETSKDFRLPRFENASTILSERGCALNDKYNCNNLGIDFERGDFGRPQNYLRAFELYGMACKLGDDQGCANRGWLVIDNKVPGKVYAEVAADLGSACNNNNGYACNNIGLAYERGLTAAGIDKTTAGKFYEKACDLDDAWGCSNLGLFYSDGDGGRAVDKAKAKQLFEKSCQLGNDQACTWAKE